ncbi:MULTISPECIES: hypothetical protein [unclassified Gilliamella]|uniref:hypothetical protein n=1 Tax=unclassified Gilliamella TaxID=2685620 RepID=UPI00226AAA12|nr:MULTISPECIES: hypothetical protein [unclassified Gilliamella]MCX8584644.1 hypothetical protein [Gilliamella sp. B3562]MCX8597747.1 hypothetical protein [Gilliamella sp. B3493]MCX8599894.1 hypothetical protein [Gilliamella sp. B3486]MCX8661569.1 hypothetical protein [Gilliamella sp. B2911]MCX8684291.1 hypothetical protein [Gilliamella sp. B2864]
MQKRVFRFLTASCLSFVSINVMALTCSDDVEQNKVEANNYIFKILDFIDSKAKGIKQEVRTSTITSDTGAIRSIAKHSLNYDSNGLITESHYDLYSDKNEKLYSEHLQKTEFGWQNVIQDIEDKTNSTIQFKTDEKGRIIASEQIKKAPDFTFIENDNYQFDNNNCLVNKNVQWQLKELNANGDVVGTVQKGASVYSFTYQNHQLAKVSAQYSNKTQNESNFSYQFDEINRLIAIHSAYSMVGKDTTNYITDFLTFNEKNDWLSASQSKQNRKNKQTNIVRQITYY